MAPGILGYTRLARDWSFVVARLTGWCIYHPGTQETRADLSVSEASLRASAAVAAAVDSLRATKCQWRASDVYITQRKGILPLMRHLLRSLGMPFVSFRVARSLCVYLILSFCSPFRIRARPNG